MEKVCVIGAGPSGIVTAKVLKENAIPYDCFEIGSGIGGVWRYNNDNGRAVAYRSLHINTSIQKMNYSDFPFPDDYPDYPSHSLLLQYFESYVEHFGLRETITFNTSVESVQPAPEGGYSVSLSTGETRSYRAVVVCSGHHWDPHWPNPPFPGAFNGEIIHSSTYRTPEEYADQNVVVLGIGNSGVDIACDIARVAKNVYLSTRSGAYIVPKYLLGIPSDHWITPASSRLPVWLQAKMLHLLVVLTRGLQKRYGIPTPKTPISAQHPTVSSDLLHYVGHGWVKVKPNIKAFEGDNVRFVDDSIEDIDRIIYCTGYNITFPFLDEDIMTVQDNQVSLYNLVVHPDREGLYFVGLVQPLGANMPLAEMQAKWIAALLTGTAVLPDKQTMWNEIQRRKAVIARRFDSRPRHTIEVEFYVYMRDLERAIKQGRKRV